MYRKDNSPKVVQLNFGDQTTPMCFILKDKDQNLEISYDSQRKRCKLVTNSKSPLKFPWIPPPCKTKKNRSNSKPNNEFIIGMPNGGNVPTAYGMPNGGKVPSAYGPPITIESNHLDNFKASFYPLIYNEAIRSSAKSNGENAPVARRSIDTAVKQINSFIDSGRRNGSMTIADAVEQSKSRIKIIKDSILSIQDTIKDLEQRQKSMGKDMSKDGPLATSGSKVMTTPTSFHAFDLQTSGGKIGNYENEDAYEDFDKTNVVTSYPSTKSQIAQRRSNDESIGKILERANGEKMFSVKEDISMPPFCRVHLLNLCKTCDDCRRELKRYSADDKYRRQTYPRAIYHQYVKSDLPSKSSRKESISNVSVDDMMIKLADSVRQSKILVDAVCQEESSTNNIQKKYIKDAEALYRDQQKIIQSICSAIDVGDNSPESESRETIPKESLSSREQLRTVENLRKMMKSLNGIENIEDTQKDTLRSKEKLTQEDNLQNLMNSLNELRNSEASSKETLRSKENLEKEGNLNQLMKSLNELRNSETAQKETSRSKEKSTAGNNLRELMKSLTESGSRLVKESESSRKESLKPKSTAGEDLRELMKSLSESGSRRLKKSESSESSQKESSKSEENSTTGDNLREYLKSLTELGRSKSSQKESLKPQSTARECLRELMESLTESGSRRLKEFGSSESTTKEKLRSKEKATARDNLRELVKSLTESGNRKSSQKESLQSREKSTVEDSLRELVKSLTESESKYLKEYDSSESSQKESLSSETNTLEQLKIEDKNLRRLMKSLKDDVQTIQSEVEIKEREIENMKKSTSKINSLVNINYEEKRSLNLELSRANAQAKQLKQELNKVKEVKKNLESEIIAQKSLINDLRDERSCLRPEFEKQFEEQENEIDGDGFPSKLDQTMSNIVHTVTTSRSSKGKVYKSHTVLDEQCSGPSEIDEQLKESAFLKSGKAVEDKSKKLKELLEQVEPLLRQKWSKISKDYPDSDIIMDHHDETFSVTLSEESENKGNLAKNLKSEFKVGSEINTNDSTKQNKGESLQNIYTSDRTREPMIKKRKNEGNANANYRDRDVTVVPQENIFEDRNRSLPQKTVYDDKNLSAAQETVYGDKNRSAPQETVYDDRNRSVPQEIVYRDRNRSIPQETVYGDKSRFVPQETVYRDKNRSAPQTVYDDRNRSAPQETVYDDRNRSAPQETVYDDKNRSVPQETVYRDRNRPVPQETVYGDRNRSALQETVYGDRNRSVNREAMPEDRRQYVPRNTFDDNVNRSAPQKTAFEDGKPLVPQKTGMRSKAMKQQEIPPNKNEERNSKSDNKYYKYLSELSSGMGNNKKNAIPKESFLRSIDQPKEKSRYGEEQKRYSNKIGSKSGADQQRSADTNALFSQSTDKSRQPNPRTDIPINQEYTPMNSTFQEDRVASERSAPDEFEKMQQGASKYIDSIRSFSDSKARAANNNSRGVENRGENIPAQQGNSYANKNQEQYSPRISDTSEILEYDLSQLQDPTQSWHAFSIPNATSDTARNVPKENDSIPRDRSNKDAPPDTFSDSSELIQYSISQLDDPNRTSKDNSNEFRKTFEPRTSNLSDANNLYKERFSMPNDNSESRKKDMAAHYKGTMGNSPDENSDTSYYLKPVPNLSEDTDQSATPNDQTRRDLFTSKQRPNFEKRKLVSRSKNLPSQQENAGQSNNESSSNFTNPA